MSRGCLVTASFADLLGLQEDRVDCRHKTREMLNIHPDRGPGAIAPGPRDRFLNKIGIVSAHETWRRKSRAWTSSRPSLGLSK